MPFVWAFMYDWQQDYSDTWFGNLRSRGRLEAKRGHDASHGYSVFKAWWGHGADSGRRCRNVGTTHPTTTAFSGRGGDRGAGLLTWPERADVSKRSLKASRG